MFSEQLGLELIMEGKTLRFYDPLQQKWLLTYEQIETQRIVREQRAQAEAQWAEAADQRADSEKQRAETAEAELARLRAELEALRQQK